MKKLLLTTIALTACLLPAKPQELIPAETATAKIPVMRDKAPLAAAQSVKDLYNVTMIIAENFDKFTKGSVGAPDTEMLDGFIDSDLTQQPLWSAYYVYQAGGCAYIDRISHNNANLCTPIIEIPQNDKPVTVTFRAHLADKEYNFDWVEVYVIDVTDPNAPRTFSNDYAYTYDEWREYKFSFDKKRTGTQFFFQFSGYDTALYLDDVEIKFLDPKLTAPVALGHSGFTNDGFTANWEPVEDADAYLISLFTIGDDRDKTRHYLQEDLRVSGNSHTFTGLETPTSTYYYTVKAVKGDIQSPESNVVKVHSLTVPQNITARTNDDNTVTISWDAVQGAEYYELTAMRAYEAETDETYVLSRENFDRLVSPGKPSVPDYKNLPMEETLDEWTDQPGWIAKNPAHINGAYGLIGYYAQNYGDDVFLESPIMDLTAGGGKVKFSADLYAQQIDLYDECAARFEMYRYIYDEKGKPRMIRTDTWSTPSLADEWMNYGADLTGGTEESVLSIWATAGYLYIDNIEISQQLKAGDKVKVPYYNAKADRNEVTIPVTDLLRGSNLSFRLCAVREIWDSMHFSVNEYVKSPLTPEYVHAVEIAGIGDVEFGNAVKVSVNDGKLTVVNPACEAVTVSDMSGRTVASEAGSQLNVIELPGKGIYIVRVGTGSFKVVR